MKILLVTYEFSPQSTVASVRPTKLYKYWKRAGHEVTVLTARKKACEDDRKAIADATDERDIVRIESDVRFEKFYERARARFASSTDGVADCAAESQTAQTVKFSGIRLLKRVASKFYLNRKFASWVKNSKRFLRSKRGKFDVIFSTFGPKPSIAIGKYAKKVNVEARWIADFRDPPKDPRQQVKIRRPQNFARRFCRRADLITAVSQGCMDELCLPKDFNNAVVTNGYDWDDRNICENPACDSFVLTVTGKIYWDNSYEPLFSACAELIGEGIVDKERTVFRAAGWNLDKFAVQAEKYGLGDRVELFGKISREEALSLQSSSQILLVETWNTEERQGVIGGKIFEYMTSEIPVAVMVNGDKTGSAIARLIKECGLGYCYEFAAPKAEELKDFIAKVYRLWTLKEKYAEQNWEEIKRYDYESIAKRILEQAASKKR